MSYFDDNNSPTGQRIAESLAKLSLALRHQSWQEALPRGLTPTQGQILAWLRERPGALLRDVAAGLSIRPATASEAVRVLAEKGLVAKSRHPDDGRALALNLTPGGREAAGAAQRWPDFLAAATETLSTEERRVLLRAVLSMIRVLQERGEIPVTAMCLTCTHFRPNIRDDPQRPHHCALVDAPLGDADLRVECPDHFPAPDDTAWQSFRQHV